MNDVFHAILRFWIEFGQQQCIVYCTRRSLVRESPPGHHIFLRVLSCRQTAASSYPGRYSASGPGHPEGSSNGARDGDFGRGRQLQLVTQRHALHNTLDATMRAASQTAIAHQSGCREIMTAFSPAHKACQTHYCWKRKLGESLWGVVGAFPDQMLLREVQSKKTARYGVGRGANGWAAHGPDWLPLLPA